MSKITLADAFDLSIKKWTWIVNNGGKSDGATMREEIPALDGMRGDCGLCEYYLEQEKMGCGECPLNIFGARRLGLGCLEWGHPYDNWSSTTGSGAQAVLDLILEKAKEKLGTETVTSGGDISGMPIDYTIINELSITI